jgi:hypothetical protein
MGPARLRPGAGRRERGCSPRGKLRITHSAPARAGRSAAAAMRAHAREWELGISAVASWSGRSSSRRRCDGEARALTNPMQFSVAARVEFLWPTGGLKRELEGTLPSAGPPVGRHLPGLTTSRTRAEWL